MTGGDDKGADAGAHHRILDCFLAQTSFGLQLVVDGGVQSDFGNDQFHLDVIGTNGRNPLGGHIATVVCTKQVEGIGVQMQFQFQIDTGSQIGSTLKSRDVRIEYKGIPSFFLQFGGQGSESVVSGTLGVTACQQRIVGHLQETVLYAHSSIDPTLRHQFGLGFFFGKIEQRAKVSQVGVIIGLFTHQYPIELDIYLFEDGVSKIVHHHTGTGVVGIGGGGGTIGGGGGGIESCVIIVRVDVQFDFHFHSDFLQINIIVRGRDVEVDGLNTRGRHGIELNFPPTFESVVGAWDLKQIQPS